MVVHYQVHWISTIILLVLNMPSLIIDESSILARKIVDDFGLKLIQLQSAWMINLIWTQFISLRTFLFNMIAEFCLYANRFGGLCLFCRLSSPLKNFSIKKIWWLIYSSCKPYFFLVISKRTRNGAFTICTLVKQ